MINLIPPAFKSHVKAQERLRLVLILGTCLMIFSLSLSLLLVAVRAYLWKEIGAHEFLAASLKDQSAARAKDLKGIEDLNSQLSALSRLYARRLSPSRILEIISSHLGPGMYLSSFGVTSTKPTKVTLTGYAQFRETLLTFREALQKDSAFTNVYFPPSNWVKQKDITFSLRAELP